MKMIVTVEQSPDGKDHYEPWWRMCHIVNSLGLLNIELESVSETGNPGKGTLQLTANFLDLAE